MSINKIYNLTLVRSTKNKHVYSDGDEGIMGAIYIPKTELTDPPPQRITITLEPAD